ncbi:metalloregulator ArsR/SmtB family transcription factor [Streptomyces sp. NPDC051320]|uniref:ArsR/SmtB family transcription factor n=1 Tax=Streptomyces sp. NPDC051320 TaxID=3154644 RepID=UPI00343C9A8B
MDISSPAVAIDVAALERIGLALADGTRRRLLLRLLEGPAYPADLADQLGLTRGNVSNHLGCLRGCGLVRSEAVGRRALYRISDPRLAHALAELAALTLLVEHGTATEPAAPAAELAGDCVIDSGCCPPALDTTEPDKEATRG